MTRLFFPLVAIALVMTFSACDNNDTFVGSDTITSDIRDVSSFTEIEMEDAIGATVTFGTEQSVTVRVNDNLVDRVNTTVSRGKLLISLQNGNYRNVDLEVTIVMPDLNNLKLSDACRANVDGFQGAENMVVDINDASRLTVTNTSVTNLTADVMDASNVEAFGLSADEVMVNVRDASTVEITANNTLSGTVRDASTLRYRGNPTETVEVADASRVLDAN
ncbi:MAG: DUF2807 domain-containing protein [Bacteroidota bacterium]